MQWYIYTPFYHRKILLPSQKWYKVWKRLFIFSDAIEILFRYVLNMLPMWSMSKTRLNFTFLNLPACLWHCPTPQHFHFWPSTRECQFLCSCFWPGSDSDVLVVEPWKTAGCYLGRSSCCRRFRLWKFRTHLKIWCFKQKIRISALYRQ